MNVLNVLKTINPRSAGALVLAAAIFIAVAEIAGLAGIGALAGLAAGYWLENEYGKVGSSVAFLRHLSMIPIYLLEGGKVRISSKPEGFDRWAGLVLCTMFYGTCLYGFGWIMAFAIFLL